MAGIMGDDVEVGDVLHFVSAANAILKAADSTLDEVIAEAIARGATWTQIGKTLGIQRTAAHKRFSKGISKRRCDEIEREGMACLSLFWIWMKQIPESTFGFSDEDWDAAPIEVFVDHAVRNAARALDVFIEAIRSYPDKANDGEGFNQFKDGIIRAYGALRGAVTTLSLPRCFPIILKYSLDDLEEYPWRDENAPVYYISMVIHLRLAFKHFTDLVGAYGRGDGVSVQKNIAYTYDNLGKALMILTRPELVRVLSRIQGAIAESGDAVYIPGDPSARPKNLPDVNELIKHVWKKDYDRVASAFGIRKAGPSPSLDELLDGIEDAEH